MSMLSPHKQMVVELLRSFVTGDSTPLKYIDSKKYIQHNLAAADGLDGLIAFREVLLSTNEEKKINIIRVFEDGDYVFTHSEACFFGPEISFDIFRFENDKIVEHWDVTQKNPLEPTPSGHTMTDGPTTAIDLDKTESNKTLVRQFCEEVLVNCELDKLAGYFDGENYIQHFQYLPDGMSALKDGMVDSATKGYFIPYDPPRKVLGEGNFVLVMSSGGLEGSELGGAFCDLFRVENGKIAEHWDATEAILPQNEWKNTNSKF